MFGALGLNKPGNKRTLVTLFLPSFSRDAGKILVSGQWSYLSDVDFSGGALESAGSFRAVAVPEVNSMGRNSFTIFIAYE
jgi:hypothetical protein